MHRVLFLAYHFPPIGGAPVQRNARLVRYLPELGYTPLVVTGPGSPSYRWTPLDETMAADGVDVHRISAPEPARSTGWHGRRERWLRLESPWKRWWDAHAVELACDVGRDAELVHASLAPYPTADAALAVAQRLGKPLLVDLEDPWALDEMLVYPTSLHRRLELRRMQRALAAADAVVMNTEEAAARVRAVVPELRARPVVAIPNGYDAADFELPAPRRTDGRFRIVHTGSLHTDLGLEHRRRHPVRRLLGGATHDVDFLTRSHVYLLEALEELYRTDESLRGTIEVHFAGVLTEQDREVAARFPEVRVHGFLPHPETIELVQSADLLFLPMHDLPEGRRVAIVPCKTYEYLASGRPIVAAVPDGDARDLLARAGTARLCRPADAPAISRAIAAELERWRAGTPAPAPREDVVRRYEWPRLADELAAVYDALLGSPDRVRTPAAVGG